MLPSPFENVIQSILPWNQLFLAVHWERGKNNLTKGGLTTGGTTRFMSVNIKLKTLGNPSKKKVKCKHHNLVLVPYYAPHSGFSEEEIEKTTLKFSEFLNQIPKKNTTTIIGADNNAAIGTNTTSDHSTQEIEGNNFEPY